PAAMLSTVLGLNHEDSINYLRGILADAKTEVPVQPDEASLITEILGVRLTLQGNVNLTVGQAIQVVQALTPSNWADWKTVLAGSGIRLEVNHIVMNYGSLRKLLRGTRWEGQPIDQVLRRVPGAELCQQSIGGVKDRGVRFPITDFIQTYIGSD